MTNYWSPVTDHDYSNHQSSVTVVSSTQFNLALLLIAKQCSALFSITILPISNPWSSLPLPNYWSPIYTITDHYAFAMTNHWSLCFCNDQSLINIIPRDQWLIIIIKKTKSIITIVSQKNITEHHCSVQHCYQ